MSLLPCGYLRSEGKEERRPRGSGERGNGEGREGGKEGIKGVEMGWGGGQDTQEKSASGHRSVALPHSATPAPFALRAAS